MQSTTKYLWMAVIAGAGVLASADASAQLNTLVQNQLVRREITGQEIVGGFQVGTNREWQHWADRDVLKARTYNRYFVNAFDTPNEYLADAQIEATTIRYKNGNKTVRATGFIKYCGITMATVDSFGAANVSDIIPNKVTKFLFGHDLRYEISQPVGPSGTSYWLDLVMFGRIDSQILAWAHTTASPFGGGEQDFAATAAKNESSLRLVPKTDMPGATVYGELTVMQGQMTANASAQRTIVGGQSRFTLGASTPANVQAFGGSAGQRNPSVEMADWGQPWSFSSELSPSQSTTSSVTNLGW